MDVDGPSSPPLRSSLPPSSAPNPTASTTGTHSSPARSRANGTNGVTNGVDALALDDIDGAADADGELENTQRRRRARAKGQLVENVPLVRDALGEQITESFETFLKT